MAWAVRGRSSEVFCPSRWRGDPARRTIALTFDDGPSESTPELLDILDRLGIRATFFQCGANVRRLPDIARRVASRHEVANHTDTHPRLWLRSPDFLRTQVAGTQRSIHDAVGITPRWFRAPYGVRWPGLRGALAPHGLTNVMWTAIGSDWAALSGSAIARRIHARIGPGGIVCLHDGREMRERPDIGNTLAAVREVVPALLDEGYAFETVTEILCPRI